MKIENCKLRIVAALLALCALPAFGQMRWSDYTNTTSVLSNDLFVVARPTNNYTPQGLNLNLKAKDLLPALLSLPGAPSIVGPQGPQGVPGTTGATGPQGPAGSGANLLNTNNTFTGANNFTGPVTIDSLALTDISTINLTTSNLFLAPVSATTTDTLRIRLWNSNNLAIWARGTNGTDKIVVTFE